MGTPVSKIFQLMVFPLFLKSIIVLIFCAKTNTW